MCLPVLHDPLAIALTVKLDLVTRVRGGFYVETKGTSSGCSLAEADSFGDRTNGSTLTLTATRRCAEVLSV